MIKDTNNRLNAKSIDIGNTLGGSACSSCTESYCCNHQQEIGIGTSEFDILEPLITKQQIERARVEIYNTNPTVCNGSVTYRCPLLSEDGKCEVYDSRPIVCASYSVVGTNHNCDKDSFTNDVSIVNPLGVFESLIGDAEILTRMLHTESSGATDILKEFKKRYKL